ncbi:MAG TPA: D-2-hydroxyacid dehydrogenase [Gaiellaceae bacterium]|nr:D-2-hydroxyacid dehydrogenase [Gaiellaceae bacterium]
MVTVLIATPIEPELVERLRAVDERLEVLYEPDLLPPPRYPSDHAGDPSFERTPEQEERFTALLSEAEVLFGFPGEDPKQLARVVDAAPNLRFVQATYAGAGQQLRAAGLDRDDLERIAFASSSGVHAGPLAEWSIFGILAFCKGLPRLLADKAARRWDHYPVDELRDSTVLIVGLGAIGREVARLAEAFGMNVLSVRREQGDLDELLPQADAIVVTLPLTHETEGLIGRDRIARMRDGAIFVNVGRGGVVDEDALVEALRSGKLRGAALDVFAHEPLPDDSPLWTLDNVIISPHTSALSTRENERVVELFAENLRRYLAGDELLSRVRTSLFY